MLLSEKMKEELGDTVKKIRQFIYPEESIIRTSLEKADTLYKKKDFETANKYFSKVITLSSPDSQEYKLAKSRVVNV